MVKKIISSLFIWLFSFSILLMLVLIPIDTVFEEGPGGMFLGATYDYQVSNHLANIKAFLVYIFDQGGLGTDGMGNPLIFEIVAVFWRSMKIFMPAILIGFFVGIIKGVFDYGMRRSKGKALGQPLTIGLLSVPDIVVIILIQFTVLFLQAQNIVDINLYGHDRLDNVLMNVLYLSIYPVMFIANITFKVLETEQGMNYVRTARSKGIPQVKVLYIHMLKNGTPKILSYANTMILYAMSNLFIVEVFTEYRGAAFYMYHTLGSATSFYVGNLIPANTISQIGYIFLFTFIILMANMASAIARSAVSVEGDER